MQGTESNILPATCRPTDPAVLPQIIEQRYPSLECFDVLAHSAFFASEAQRKRDLPAFPGKDGGRTDLFSQTQRQEEFKNRSQPG